MMKAIRECLHVLLVAASMLPSRVFLRGGKAAECQSKDFLGIYVQNGTIPAMKASSRTRRNFSAAPASCFVSFGHLLMCWLV